VPYDEFVKTWTTPEPPAHLPYMGSWDQNAEVYGIYAGQRVKMQGPNLQSQFMLNPKDVRIMELEAEVKGLRAKK
jgi:acetone carboxylase alpha subunit